MNPTALMLGTVVLLATVLAALAIPGRSDIVLYQFLDGDYVSARTHYEDLYRDGDRSERTLLMLAQIAIIEDRHRAASVILQEAAAAGINDAHLRKFQAMVADSSTSSSATHNAVQLASETATSLRAALAHHDSVGNTQQVRAILQELGQRNTASRDERIRLGMMLAASGELAGAADALSNALRDNATDIPHHVWKTTLSLLQEKQRSADVRELAQLWLAQHNDSNQRLAVGYWLIDKGWSDVADSLYANSDGGGEALLAYAALRKGDRAGARQRLAALWARGTLPAEFERVYAELVVDAGRATEARTLLPSMKRSLSSADIAYRLLYIRVMSVAKDVHGLLDYWREFSVGRQPDAAEREAMIVSLVQAGRYEEVWPALKKASLESASGFSTLRTAALALGKLDALAEVALQRGSDARLTGPERRDAARVLLELGRKGSAALIFQELLVDRAPDDALMSELLFIWGPRPDADALNWLTERVTSSNPAQRAAWMDMLIDLGGAHRIVQVAGSRNVPWRGEARFAHLRALAELGQWSDFGVVADAIAIEERDVSLLVKAAAFAERAPDLRKADALWTAVLQLDPANGAAIRAVGLSAYRRKDWIQARMLLERDVKRQPHDWETTFALGESLKALGDAPQANRYYEATAKILARAEKPDARQALMMAIIAGRLGQFEQARSRFEELLETRRGDPEILAEYASLLMSRGMYSEARKLLHE